MTIQNVIEKAIEGGYFPFKEGKIEYNEKTKSWWHIWMSEDENGEAYEASRPLCWEHSLYFNKLVLCPLFWSCLGRAMGWDGYMKEEDYREILYYSSGTIFGWLAVQHHLVDHLASGQSVESFFEGLTNKNQ